MIYASESGGRGRQEFVEEGATVRERQTLIQLPDVTRMVATLKVHEASVDKVRAGQRARITVDAFTDRPFGGNPAAVCILDEPLEERVMQSIAAEMNLSETAFLLHEGENPIRESSRFSLRWFTPEVEVPLCGHATLGTAAGPARKIPTLPSERVAWNATSPASFAATVEKLAKLSPPVWGAVSPAKTTGESVCEVAE